MKTVFTLIAATSLAWAMPAAAHGDDHSPRHGGIVVESRAADFELVARAERIVFHVRDHGKPGNTAGASGKLILLSGKDRSEALLTPAGSDRLEASGPFKLGPGTKIVATVQLAGKPLANLRFTL